MYYIEMCINGEVFENYSDCTIAELYRAAVSIIRFGMRHRIKIRVKIWRDDSLVAWLYSRPRDNDRRHWIARHNGCYTIKRD